MTFSQKIQYIRFDDSFDEYDSSKSPEHLAYLILQNSAGEINHIKGYTENEQKQMAKILIYEDCIQGSFNGYDIVWSKIRRKGIVIKEELKEKLNL